jgi:hypothetical protein
MVALTVTKKRILAVLCFILAAVLAVCACIQGARAIQAASTKRSLPIYNVQTDEKKIAISFDAAWGNEQTQTLIDILKQYNVHATFFVVGAWVDKYPDSVKALAEAGHEVCVHRNYCQRCHKLYDAEFIRQSTGIPLCDCGGVIKPDVVLYEEGLDQDTLYGAVEAIRNADMLIIGGTSLAVYPAAGLVHYYSGNRLVLINKTTTPMDANANLALHGSIGEILGQIQVPNH